MTRNLQVTEEKLRKWEACPGGVEWFDAQDNSDLREVCEALSSDGHTDWANWLIVRYMTKKQSVLYAVFAAESVLHYFEEKFTSDDRPRKAIEAAKEYLKRPGKKQKHAARAAAGDAVCAAWAAGDAVCAAWAARAAARAAAGDAAGAAAWAAARDAAGDAARAARAAQLEPITKYGLSLLYGEIEDD